MAQWPLCAGSPTCTVIDHHQRARISLLADIAGDLRIEGRAQASFNSATWVSTPPISRPLNPTRRARASLFSLRSAATSESLLSCYSEVPSAARRPKRVPIDQSVRQHEGMNLDVGVRERGHQLQLTTQRLDVLAKGADVHIVTALQL